jgi:hypothetical protein
MAKKSAAGNYHRFSQLPAVALASVLLLTGCGVSLTTDDILNIEAESFDGAYVSYFLPRGELSVVVGYDKKTGLLSLQHDDKAKIVPDLSQNYHLVYKHHGLSNDSINIQTDTNGIIKELSSTTADQSVELVKSVNQVLTQVGSLQEATAKILTVTPPTELPNEQVPCSHDLRANLNIDITYMKWVKDDRQWSSKCSVEVKADIKLIDSLPMKGFPNKDRSLSNFSCRDVVCFRLFGGYRVEVRATLYVDGKVAKINGDEVVAKSVIETLAPVPDMMGFIRFKRRAFVKNTTTATFTGGMLTGFKSEDPSEIIGFLNLPTEILKTTTLLITL